MDILGETERKRIYTREGKVTVFSAQDGREWDGKWDRERLGTWYSLKGKVAALGLGPVGVDG